MKRKNSLTDFVEHQEILNNIQTSIKRIYADDEMINNEEFLAELTRRTLSVIEHFDDVFENLILEEGIKNTANTFGVPTGKIAQDIVEVMMFSTIARQNIIIETLQGDEE